MIKEVTQISLCKEVTAISFYKELKKKRELCKYKLINDLFIVKYLNDDISVFVGEFNKSGSVFNETKNNIIRLIDSEQKFNKKTKQTLNSFGNWKNLDIGFKEKPIISILEIKNLKGG